MASAAARETQQQRLRHRVGIDRDEENLARVGGEKDVPLLDERVGLHAPGRPAARFHHLQDTPDGDPGVHQLDAHRQRFTEPEDAPETGQRPYRDLGRRASRPEKKQPRENGEAGGQTPSR